MQVDSFLSSSAAKQPDQIGLICGSQRLTYREIDEHANRLANRFIADGLQRGDRVVIQLENSAEAVFSIFAALKAGGVFVVIHPGVPAPKLAAILNDCGPRVMVNSAARMAALSAGGTGVPSLETVYVRDEEPETGRGPLRLLGLESVLADRSLSAAAPRPRCIDVDLAALIYTSGSTGKPKGVMLTHLNMVSAATSITTYLENTSDDIILNVLPISFDYGLYQLLMAFKIGGKLVLERSFTYVHTMLETMARERVTGLPIVPTTAAMLLQMDLSKYHFPSLRYITNTGAALPTDHIQKLRRAFPGTTVYSMYGLTECKRVSYLPPDQLDIRPGSVGRGMPNEEVYLVDDEGRRLPNGSTGELVVRGSNVMKGYWDMPEETAKMLKPGPFPWEQVLYTGDVFRSDEEGYLYFAGRKDDIIKTKGEKVSPKEVEDVLCRMSDIAEAAVIGVPDLILGQAVKAVICLRSGSQAGVNDVLRHCSRHLEPLMVPKIVEFVDVLPKSSNGKIDKKQLAAVAQGVA